MATFGELRRPVMAKNSVDSFIGLRDISPAHDAYWEDMSGDEFRRGYDHEGYLKPGTPAPCDMDLLDAEEFQGWLARCPTRSTRLAICSRVFFFWHLLTAHGGVCEEPGAMTFHARLDLPKRSLRFDLAAALAIAALTLFGTADVREKKESGFFDRLRALSVERLADALDPPLSDWASGLLLGADEGFSRKWQEIFRRTGTTHLTAVSGYNVALVMSAAFFVLDRLSAPRHLRVASGLGLVAAFVLLTGHPSSVVRAALMAGLTEAARWFGRPLKPLRALLLAALIASVAAPGVLARDLGFELSLAATFGLAAVAPPLRETLFRNWPGESGEWASQTVAATVMTAPIILRLSGEYSLVTFVSNILLAACVPVLMAAAAVVLLAAWILPLLGAAIGFAASPFLGAPLLVLRALASVPHAVLSGRPAWIAVVTVQAAALFVIIAWRRRAGVSYAWYEAKL